MRTDQRGFTIVEVLVAAFVLVVGLLGVVAMVDGANQNTVKTRGREGATSLGRHLVESIRAIPFEEVNQNSLESRLQAQPGLASLPGSPDYAIRRRNFTYTIDTSVCSLDDPRDGIGSHAGGGFCSVAWKDCALLDTTASAQASGTLAAILGGLYPEAQAAAGATSCTTGTAVAADVDPEDYKRVVVQLRWGGRQVQQTALVPNPGNSGSPAVTNLELTAPGSSLLITTNPSTLSFRATTNRTPATLDWSVDGERRGTASGSATTWNFDWEIKPREDPGAVLDGSYIVGARAMDAYGLAGASRTVTVTLNRSDPRAPSGVAAGRNGSVVEVEWQSNPERDVIGYRVYRTHSGGGTVQVCPATAGDFTSATHCQDTTPPAVPLLEYHVVALDRRPGDNAPREGAPSPQVQVTQTNTPPSAPTNLQASTSAGNTVLLWSAPSVPDPDPGDSIQFYRIYRDGSTYADRYDRTGSGSEVSYTDTATGGVSHTYWVTAVDEQLAESVVLGPVTR